MRASSSCLVEVEMSKSYTVLSQTTKLWQFHETLGANSVFVHPIIYTFLWLHCHLLKQMRHSFPELWNLEKRYIICELFSCLCFSFIATKVASLCPCTLFCLLALNWCTARLTLFNTLPFLVILLVVRRGKITDVFFISLLEDQDWTLYPFNFNVSSYFWSSCAL